MSTDFSEGQLAIIKVTANETAKAVVEEAKPAMREIAFITAKEVVENHAISCPVRGKTFLGFVALCSAIGGAIIVGVKWLGEMIIRP